MPINLKRQSISSKLERVSYSKGLKIKRDVAGYLSSHTQAFTADEIVPRIDTAAHPVMVEHVLSHHNIFTYGKKDGKIYWYIEDEDVDKASKIASRKI